MRRKLIDDCHSDKRPTFEQLSDPALFDVIFLEASEIGLKIFDAMWKKLSGVFPFFIFIIHRF